MDAAWSTHRCTSPVGSSADAWRRCRTSPARRTATSLRSDGQHAADGLIVYVEAAEDDAAVICRNLHGLRLAGWFDHARAVTRRPDARTRPPPDDAARGRPRRLGPASTLPIVFDVEIGHVPPHLPLVNGALATLTVDGDTRELRQQLG